MAQWRVVIAAHEVGRWRVPERETVVGAEEGEDAKLRTLRWAHADAGVPALRSLLRESWPHVRADRYVDPDADKVQRMRDRAARREAGGR